VKGSAAARLRRLRWLLTALFTAINAVGLVVLAWLLVRDNAEQGHERLDAEVHRVTSTVKRLLQYDGTTLDTSLIDDDEIDTQCPRFAVLPGDTGAFEGHVSARACVEVDLDVLNGAAREAVLTQSFFRAAVGPTDGGLVWVGADPFRNDRGQYIGAVVAAVDADPTQAEHDRLVLLVVGGCTLLVAAVALGGHLLSGRAIRPAVAALEQQELLLAETAHDLRSPVAALRALAETAQRNPAEREELLTRTVNLAARMGGIIDDLLTRARLAAGVEQLRATAVRLDELVTAVVAEAAAGSATVTVTTAPTTVTADAALVQRAVGNLLDNALKYGRHPGSDAVVHITVAGGRVIVADHGPGIDPEVVEERFDRFSTTGGSSGLGLAIVRWVAQAHGGSLRVYNAEAGGAIFELVFPEATSDRAVVEKPVRK
jgi:two-component system OmpR family sensor kinase